MSAQKIKLEREKRIKERGSFETFVENFSGRDDQTEEAALARAVRWAIRIIESHEEISSKLARKFAENPGDTMSWGMEYFCHAADYAQAMLLKQLFEEGIGVMDMADYLLQEIKRKASFPKRSTSPAANIYEQEELRATTTLFGYLDER